MTRATNAAPADAGSRAWAAYALLVAAMLA